MAQSAYTSAKKLVEQYTETETALMEADDAQKLALYPPYARVGSCEW